MSHFLVDGVLSDVRIDSGFVNSMHLSQYARRVMVTGQDYNGNTFSTPLLFLPSTELLSATYVLGQDWINLARINAACE